MFRFLSKIVAAFSKSARRGAAPRQEQRGHLNLESLEDRQVLSPNLTGASFQLNYLTPQDTIQVRPFHITGMHFVREIGNLRTGFDVYNSFSGTWGPKGNHVSGILEWIPENNNISAHYDLSMSWSGGGGNGHKFTGEIETLNSWAPSAGELLISGTLTGVPGGPESLWGNSD